MPSEANTGLLAPMKLPVMAIDEHGCRDRADHEKSAKYKYENANVLREDCQGELKSPDAFVTKIDTRDVNEKLQAIAHIGKCAFRKPQ
jgi:hypothetical protein